MGDIVRKVNICGLTEAAERLGCIRNIDALVDQGATKSVISSNVARRLKGSYLMEIPIEGRQVPTKLAALKLHAHGCGEQPLIVAVDDALVGRAGKGPRGRRIEIILGHDYMEAERAGTRYAERGDEVVCHAAPLTSLAGVPANKVVRRTRRR